MAVIKTKIVTPQKLIFEGDVVYIYTRNVNGYMGIKPRHAPLLTILDIGQLKLTLPDNKDLLFALSEGTLELSNNICTIISEAIEPKEEIDIERARKAKEQNKALLKGEKDVTRAETILRDVKKAENRIKVAES